MEYGADVCSRGDDHISDLASIIAMRSGLYVSICDGDIRASGRWTGGRSICARIDLISLMSSLCVSSRSFS